MDRGELFDADAAQRLVAAFDDSSRYAIVLETLDGTISAWSRTAELLLGYAGDEIIGHSMSELVPADLADEELARRARIATGASVTSLATRRHDKRRRLVDVSVYSTPLCDSSGKVLGAVTIMHDPPSPTDVDAQLEHVHRLVMSIRIAHEINNPLAVVTTNLDSIARELPALPKSQRELLAQLVEEAREGAQRIQNVVRTLTSSMRIKGRRPHNTNLESSGTSGRILIVDDDILLANALRRPLSREHVVTVLHRGKDAVELIRGGARFDAIVCDLMMPDLTGVDVHALLTTFAPDQAARMIFITGGVFGGSLDKFLGEIPNPCFEKPCDLGDLRRAIQALVDGILVANI